MAKKKTTSKKSTAKPSKPITLRPYQMDCEDTIERAGDGRHLVVLATGLGKCLGRGTPVLMYDGTVKNVEYIKEGELIMGPDSGPRRVRGVVHGQSKLFRVIPTKGDPYVVNDGHILSLKITGVGNGCPNRRVTASDGRKFLSGDICNISVNDYLASSKTFRHVAKGWRAAVQFNQKIVEIPPYILGVWLGDGSAATTQITTMDAEVVKTLHRYASDNGLTLSVCSSTSTGKALTYSITNTSNHKRDANVFRAALRKYNLLDNKHIPADYLVNDRETRLELLAGLLDSDGSVAGNVYEITTYKLTMSEQILFLARSLGFAAYRSEKIVNDTVYYRIIISGDTQTIPTKVERKKATPRKQKKDVLVTGIHVEPAGFGDYYGFELEGADKLFLLGDFTVTHNTAIFTNMKRHGRTLILSHRDELVRQPEKYYAGQCSFGIEKASEHSNGEDIVSASVPTLCSDARLAQFKPDEFDTIIVDEAHHAAAPSYKKILNYFSGAKRVLGFTATPKRGDNVRLTDVFDDIIFSRDLRWGIENGYLSRIRAEQVETDYTLRNVTKMAGDFSQAQLDKVLKIGNTLSVSAKTYIDRCHAKGRHTLIYCVSRDICYILQKTIIKLLPKSEQAKIKVLTGETPDEERKQMLKDFSDGKILCIINCMVLTEGTDLPICDTVINLRPTCNASLYQQMVGRGTRLFSGKDHCLIIDIVPGSQSNDSRDMRNLCTAPTLFGIDPSKLSKEVRANITGETDLLQFCNELSSAFAAEANLYDCQIIPLNIFISERERLLEENRNKGIKAFAQAYMSLLNDRQVSDEFDDFDVLDVEIQADDAHYYKITPSWDEVAYISKPDMLGQSTLDMTVNGGIIGKRKQIRAVGTGRIGDLINLVKMYCMIQNGATEYSWNKKTQALWATQDSTSNQQGKVWQIFKDTGVGVSDASNLNKLEACKLIDLGENLSRIRQRKHLIEQSCVTDDKGKLTPEAKAAKAELDKMFKAENKETKKAQALFGDLKQAIATKYKEHMDLLARNKSRSDAQVDEEGRFFDINLSFAPQKIAATPKQVSYAKSLILRAQGYENYFPGVDPQHFDRRQAQLFIGLLVMLDSQHERVPRTFTDACEVLRDVSLHAPFKRCYRFHYVSQNDLSTDTAMSS